MKLIIVVLNEELETGKQPNQDEQTIHNESGISIPRTDARLSGQNCSKIQPPRKVCITHGTPNEYLYALPVANKFDVLYNQSELQESSVCTLPNKSDQSSNLVTCDSGKQVKGPYMTNRPTVKLHKQPVDLVQKTGTNINPRRRCFSVWRCFRGQF